MSKCAGGDYRYFSESRRQELGIAALARGSRHGAPCALASQGYIKVRFRRVFTAFARDNALFFSIEPAFRRVYYGL
jgi:hypothetical protein